MAHELSEGELERIAAFARTRRYDRKPDMLRPEVDDDDPADPDSDRARPQDSSRRRQH